MNVGDWVRERYETRERFGSDQYGFPNYVTRPAFRHAKIVAIEGDTATLQFWTMAQISRRTKAFGRPIDKTPYRVEAVYKRPVSCLAVLVDGAARQQENRQQQILRYPTRSQRDNARAKRRKEARR